MKHGESKAVYEAPVLTVHGTLETITQGGSTGTKFDGNFTQGQPIPNPLNIFS